MERNSVYTMTKSKSSSQSRCTRKDRNISYHGRKSRALIYTFCLNEGCQKLRGCDKVKGFEMQGGGKWTDGILGGKCCGTGEPLRQLIGTSILVRFRDEVLFRRPCKWPPCVPQLHGSANRTTGPSGPSKLPNNPRAHGPQPKPSPGTSRGFPLRALRPNALVIV